MSVKAYPHLVTTKQMRRQAKVEAVRKRWLAMKLRFPSLSLRGLREKLPAEYMVLWRYDLQWLKANIPPRPKRRTSVDWAKRDQQLCRKIETASYRLRHASPFRLARAVGVQGWWRDRFAKMPQARKALERLASLGRN